MALRWKKDPKPTGLMAVGARPRGSKLYDGEITYASVRPDVYQHRVTGWWWSVPTKDGIPYQNTCETPVPTEDEAKAQAMAYIKKCLAAIAESQGKVAAKGDSKESQVKEHDENSLMSGYEPTMPLSEGGTDRYNEGWKYGDWFLSKGGSTNADACSHWHDEKCSGFWDRLAAEKRAVAEAVDVCEALTGKAKQVLVSSLSHPAGTKLQIDWYETRSSNFDKKPREYIRDAAEAAGFVEYRGGHPWVTEAGHAWATKPAPSKSRRAKAS